MLLLPLVCVVVRSARQFRLQCTLKVCSDGNDVIASGSPVSLLEIIVTIIIIIII